MSKEYKQIPYSPSYSIHLYNILRPSTWKHFVSGCWQRLRYGISWPDCWNLDIYLATVIVNGLIKLRYDGHGYSSKCETPEEWYQILDKIIAGYSLYIESAQRVLTDQEWEQYEVAKQLFSENFSDLWD